MASILDCVLLSEDVYEDGLTSRVAARGWTRTHTYTCGGFYACHYSKNGDSIIAYRGTNDLEDVVADANMIPSMGRIPPSQSRAAVQVFDTSSQCTVNDISAVTGHSLGGALAKVVSQQKNVTAVAFNAPLIGDLNGVAPRSSPLIHNFNAINDPVSGITGAMGSLSVGGVHEVIVRPPVLGEMINSIVGVRIMGHLHYHSIETLRKAIESSGQYASIETGNASVLGGLSTE